ncbi:subclass B3 metallo-beta-lactamase [Rhodanobacter sp. B04]|uniref:subclass B3 metallo-beta-lactamase n=1 Tax=Rhodanobacter sp. B04 TaxID=1945860 RepID=UPI0009855DD4|nr:subclass B3 metallo-beta-lactamase [Rhodanobacter sp. B04]OOG61355.1 subclass B3 metallo-beta-lactamase [Rhodanobacter sp. B04]
MKRFACHLFIGVAAIAALSAHAEEPSWHQPHKPFQVYGNTYYVGTEGLSAILITSPQGDILIDGTLQRNAPLIEANIRALGFRIEDVRVILNSHAHSDHAGAIAELAAASGAHVRASAAGARALMAGGNDPEDPQFGEALRYPPVAHVDVVPDGGTVRVGNIELTAHYTPGHTPGSTSWTWRSCAGGRCLDMVYADSLSAISSDGFHFSDDATHAHRVEDFRRSLTTIAALPCDILMVPHPDAIGFMEKVTARDRGRQPNPLIDPHACQAYAAAAGVKLEARLARERQDHATH